MSVKSLREAVAARPFPEYAQWWPMGTAFLNLISRAIVSEWSSLRHNDGSLETVRDYVTEYLEVVFGKRPRASLVDEFVNQTSRQPVYSGEFDALSYAFYRSAYELIERHADAYSYSVERERRLFTIRVGKVFFEYLCDHLDLALPPDLSRTEHFDPLNRAIHSIGQFLTTEGYLRDRYFFSFDVDVEYNGRRIKQSEATFITDLQNHGIAYALYEMAFPAIFPSARYLYATIGESQHFSSRTFEALFEVLGYEAHETDDFDPRRHNPGRVVELWQIKKLAS